MSPNKFPGVVVIVLTWVLAWVVVGLTTWLGVAGNSLHTSAQSWAFVVILGVLGAYGVGSLAELWAKKP